MSTTYKLGEVCKWSVLHTNKEAHRYVTVKTPYANGLFREQVLELPEEEAYRLVSSSGNPEIVLPLMDKVYDNGWVARSCGWTFPGLASILSNLALKHTAWLQHINLKYIVLRIDMRDGNFHVSDATGDGGSRVRRDVIAMIKANYEKQTTETN